MLIVDEWFVEGNAAKKGGLMPAQIKLHWPRAALVWMSAMLVWLVAAAPSSALPRFRWSAPVLVDSAVPRASISLGLVTVSCPSVSLCVAFDSEGRLVTSTDPAVPTTWKVAKVGGEPLGVSCPSVSLCVGVGLFSRGALLVSTKPTGGAGAWRVVSVAAGVDAGAVSCPSLSLCVAGGQFNGDILTSTDPAGSSQAWRVEHVDRHASVLSISCPAVTLCVAADDAGNLLSSTNPDGGASAWHIVHIGETLTAHAAVSCASVTLCVAVEDGHLLTSTNPTGSPAAWRVNTVDALGLVDSISCPSTSFCAAGDIFGGAATTINPAAGPRGWELEHVDGTNAINAVTCPSVNLCVAVDASGNVVIGGSVAPTLTVPTIRVGRPADAEQLTAVRRGSRLRVDTGLAIACPPGARECTVHARASAPTDTGPPDVLASMRLAVPAGHRREIILNVSRHGVRVLRKQHGFIDFAQVTVVTRAQRGHAVANTLLCSIQASRAALRSDRYTTRSYRGPRRWSSIAFERSELGRGVRGPGGA